MKQVRTYCLLFSLIATTVLAQRGDNAASVALPFQDSVRVVLENTRNIDAGVVGSSFAAAWSSLGPDQQIIIQRQAWQLRKKRLPLKPTIIHYFGAIANAVSIEKADAAHMGAFLTVAGKVIENESPSNIQNFFAISRTFFQFHALHYEKPFRLYAIDDDYTFDYVAPTPTFDVYDTASMAPVDETTPVETTEDSYADDTDPYADQAYDTAAAYSEAPPLWMNPPPQPVLEGPVLKFNRVTLNFVTKFDSVFLKNTKGSLSLRNKIFVGEEGSFDWSAAHLPPDSVSANMTVYNFNASRAELKADLVKLNYTGRTPGYIPGTFEFKSETRKDSVPSSFPRFKSYQSALAIQGVGDESVKYTGGFGLIGRKVTSTSVSGEPATIEISHNGERKFKARSAEFLFTDSTIISSNSKIAIYQGYDSITHPGVRMRYKFGDDSLKQISIRKERGPLKNTPYSSTYFSVDFSTDVINWNLFSDSLNLLTDGARHTVPMVIESQDFFNSDDYRLLKGEGFSFHALSLVANYCLKKRVREFYSGDLVQFSGKEVRDIKAAIQFLESKGMLTYDAKTDVVNVKEKAILIFKANKGESDYDNLKIHSVIDSTANASLNFAKGTLVVRGVREFKVSDSLNVRITPDSSIITLLQNRDIQFDGTINAGNFEISGKGFMLKYDSFYISLSHIDSINFFVTETNAKGQSVRRKVNNNMVGTDSTAAAAGGLMNATQESGILYISKAGNKSGTTQLASGKKVSTFPKLDASGGGVIYFDRREVLSGAYDRSMFFVVPPFNLDSLNDADPAAINFDGTFISSGMFPSFKEKLHTQPDKSLGFEHLIPSSGYQLYGGDGNMHGALSMNNRGLRGAGRIDFLAASVYSYDFLFYPDSVITRGQRVKIKESNFNGVNFPQASFPDYEMKWLPKQDQMRIKSLKESFNFYDSTAQMRGTVTISKEGVAGAGKLETRGSELISRNMIFSSDDFSARHSRFKVKTDDPNKPLLNGVDVRVKFNLEQNYADISPEVAGVAAIDFPYAQFKTSIPEMRWDLTAQKITMNKDPDVPIEDSYFYTTRKELDSLHFNAESAEYDLKTQQLKVRGIPYITVADARITPENNEVLILENAKIGTLKNTTIILDTLNAYHRLTEGVVDIISRKEFTGYATYQYVNFLKDTFAIKMTDFHLEPIQEIQQTKRSSRASKRTSVATHQTVGTGAVDEKEKLVLGAGMFYKGDMVMYATRPALQLKGSVKLDIKNLKNYNTWIQYEQTGEETEVLIDFENSVTEDGRRVHAGLHFDTNNELYITFINDKKSEDDEDFFKPSGFLHYDTASREFKIENLEKAAGNSLSGKVFAYKDATLDVRFEGPISLFSGVKDFNITATAIGQGNMQTNDIRMNNLLVIDTNVPVQAFDIMAKQIQDVIKNEGAEEGLGDQTELLYKIADIVGERVAKDYEQRSLQNYVSLGTLAPLAKPLVFSNVNLKWSQKQKAFYSEGTLGISNIGRNDINGAFEGFMEVRKNEDGAPVFHVFIKASPEAWYYFGYEDNRLMVYSSNDELNGVISKKSNAGKVKIGEVAFIPGSEDETLTFINRFRKVYYGIDVPYSLSDGSSAPKKQREETVEEARPDDVNNDKKTEEKTEEKKKEEDDGF